MKAALNLLPLPQSVEFTGGGVPCDGSLPAAREELAPREIARDQGYELTVSADGVTIRGHDAAGLFYGRRTLEQLERQFAGRREVPALLIRDWPDYADRGVMLDISRDKVPTMETLYSLVDRLASWKINQFQLYMEHTFAYPAHHEVWRHASPLTAEQIEQLDAYCRARYMELVPLQNSFGHMHRWLKHDRYRRLAECPQGFPSHWAMHDDEPFSICVSDPAALDLVSGLFDELLPHFSSRRFNIGGDETFDLGKGRSREVCDRKGIGRVYLEFLRWLHREVAGRDRQMMFFGDIIINYPELIPELPREAVALHWGYGADFPFDEHCAHFAAAGNPFYVLPSTSTYSSVAGRTRRMLGNIRNAAENGIKHGALGLLNTDWGDLGTWHPLPVCYAGMAYGAAMSWSPAENAELDLPGALSSWAFGDDAGIMGRLACDLGRVHESTAAEDDHSNLYHALLRTGLRRGEDKCPFNGMSLAGLEQAESLLEGSMAQLSRADMRRPDARLIADEFRYAAEALRLSINLSREVLSRDLDGAADLPEKVRKSLSGKLADIKALHRRNWLARNRPGGLEDSIFWYGTLERALQGQG